MSGFIIPNRNVKGLPNNVLGYGQGFTFTSTAGYQRITDFSDLALKTLNDQLEQLWVRTQSRDPQTGDYSTTALMVGAELANPRIMGRAMFAGKPQVRYVSSAGNDSNDGLTEQTPFCSILCALQSLPMICDQGAVIYCDAPSSGRYFERLWASIPLCGDLRIVGRQRVTFVGSIRFGPAFTGTIAFENFVFQGTCEELVEVVSPGASVSFHTCDFVMGGDGCRGILARGGSVAALGCGFYGCGLGAIEAWDMGRIGMHNCVGSGNGFALKAEGCAIAVQSGTRPVAVTPSIAQEGGVILGTATASAGTAVTHLGYRERVFSSTATMSALDLEFLEDPSPAQGKDRVTGKEYKGYWVFDSQDVITQLSGKTPVAGRIQLKRKPGAGTKDRVKVYLYLHSHTGPMGDAVVGGPLGNVASLAPDESQWAPVTSASIQAIQSGYTRGYAVYSPISGEELEFYSQAEYPADLWVVYQ
mgnify:CR=1 FL=1